VRRTVTDADKYVDTDSNGDRHTGSNVNIYSDEHRDADRDSHFYLNADKYPYRDTDGLGIGNADCDCDAGPESVVCTERGLWRGRFEYGHSRVCGRLRRDQKHHRDRAVA
jgi:hypothetical protein